MAKEDSEQLIRRTIQIGGRRPMCATPSGKAILAFLSEQEIHEYFSTVNLIPVTPKTITDPNILREQLKEIRTTGIAYSREDNSDGITGVAAPIFDLYGMVAACILISAPFIRFTAEKEEVIKHSVKETSIALSNKLGFRE